MLKYATTLAITLCFVVPLCIARDAIPLNQSGVPAGRIVISGTVPDEATKADLLARLQDVYGKGQIDDRLSVGDVMAPPDWSSEVSKLMSLQLKLIKKGQLVVEGTAVSLRGEVDSESTRQEVAGLFSRALNSSYVIKNGLRVTTESQAVLDRVLANRIVGFEHGSALLTESGKHILDDMVEALKKLDMNKFEVIGHTDNLGAPAHNLALSRSRADSVKTYLVAKGIRAEQIGTTGMGADLPIMSNNTEEGRKRNRRIEFRASR